MPALESAVTPSPSRGLLSPGVIAGAGAVTYLVAVLLGTRAGAALGALMLYFPLDRGLKSIATAPARARERKPVSGWKVAVGAALLGTLTAALWTWGTAIHAAAVAHRAEVLVASGVAAVVAGALARRLAARRDPTDLLELRTATFALVLVALVTYLLFSAEAPRPPTWGALFSAAGAVRILATMLHARRNDEGTGAGFLCVGLALLAFDLVKLAP